jgi:hypothetical protein
MSSSRWPLLLRYQCTQVETEKIAAVTQLLFAKIISEECV